MGGPRRSFQENLLSEPIKILDGLLSKRLKPVHRNSLRLEILEKCSSHIGGFDYKRYCEAFGFRRSLVDDQKILKLSESIKTLPIPHSIALSILSTGDFESGIQKSTGAFYTDFRLAMKLSEALLPVLSKTNEPKIIDLACGSGILLCATVELFSKVLPVNQLLSDSIFGIDLSKGALRGTLLSLSSNTKSMQSIKSLHSHLLQADTLLLSSQDFLKLGCDKFDGVIGNPPWEKLKLSKHEFLKSNGHDIHYGQDEIKVANESKLKVLKNRIQNYSESIAKWLPGHRGEVDLFMPFLSMAISLAKPMGRIAQIVPASLIRNQGTVKLRELLFFNSADINIGIYDNRSAFFKIDSRFKFLLVDAKVIPSTSKAGIINLSKGGFTKDIFNGSQVVKIKVNDLIRIRKDLSIPETSSQAEWDIFKRLSLSFKPFGSQPQWAHAFNREVDMTLDKKLFKSNIRGAFRKSDGIAVIEGRMLHQFRTGIKEYVSGSGRKAVWKESSSERDIVPQFFIERKEVPYKHLDRIKKQRAGFCDITGQTNERTILAGMVPANTISGNKVPTIDFVFEEEFPGLPYLWVALANSFIFDWLARRVITTNANFFILDSIPIPTPDYSNSVITQITMLSQEIIEENGNGYSWDFALKRAQIDALVASLYGIQYNELKMILDDFPSLDKRWIDLKNKFCTLTKDIVLYLFLQIVDDKDLFEERENLKSRILLFERLGMIPFVPSQFNNLNYQTPVEECLQLQPLPNPVLR